MVGLRAELKCEWLTEKIIAEANLFTSSNGHASQVAIIAAKTKNHNDLVNGSADNNTANVPSLLNSMRTNENIEAVNMSMDEKTESPSNTRNEPEQSSITTPLSSSQNTTSTNGVDGSIRSANCSTPIVQPKQQKRGANTVENSNKKRKFEVKQTNAASTSCSNPGI